MFCDGEITTEASCCIAKACLLKLWLSEVFLNQTLSIDAKKASAVYKVCSNSYFAI